jgi:WD40 repeat protein
VWDAEKVEKIRTFGELKGQGICPVAWSPDGKYVAATDETVVHIWDTAKWEPVQTLDKSEYWSCSLAWSPDGKTLAVGKETYHANVRDTTIRLWDAQSWKLARTLETGSRGVHSIRWLNEGKQIAASVGENEVQFWDAEKGELLRTVEGAGAGSLSPDGKFVATVSTGAHVTVWSTDDGRTVGRLVPLPREQGVLISPDGHYRGTPRAERDLVYVVRKEDGGQETLTPQEFADKYGWKNDPTRFTCSTSSLPSCP